MVPRRISGLLRPGPQGSGSIQQAGTGQLTSAKYPGSRGADRRSATRYVLALPITIRLPQQAEVVTGISRDMSVRGVYFTADREFTRGSVLDVSFTLPAEITEGTEVFVRAQGAVVRVETGSVGGRVGVAMVIEKYEIVRAKSDQRN